MFSSDIAGNLLVISVQQSAISIQLLLSLAALEAAVLRRLDRGLHRDVDLLLGRGHDVRAQVGLVGVDADALDALLLGRVERAEAALARHLEDDLRALLDLVA